MGISERKEREKVQRRNDIIDAAEKLFFTRGIETTTMDDVAEQAEYSKGTLYLYFKNKDDLYGAINARGLEQLTRMFREARKKAKTGHEQVRQIGEAYHRFFHEHHNYFNMMLTCGSRTAEPDLENEDDKWGNLAIQEVAQAVTTGIEDGTIRSDLDPLSTAITLWGQSTGILQIVHSHGSFFQEHYKINNEQLIESAMSLINNALKNK